MNEQHYGFSKVVDLSPERAEQRLIEQLKEEGFGVLTEIDVKATMKKKLDVDFRPYKILGACNPKLAHRALSAEDEIGLLLPCNAIVYQNGKGETVVSAINPMQAMSVVDNAELGGVAQEVTAKLKKVIEAV